MDVLNPDKVTKSVFVNWWGESENATNLPEESIGAISSSETVEEATLTFVTTFPETSDTFAFAAIAPGRVSNTTLSPTL